METQNALAVGDVHGRWGWLASILMLHRPDVCLCLGDFGWFPWLIGRPEPALPAEVLERTELRFIDGNHENHADLMEIVPRGCFEAAEISPNLFYQPRGSQFRLADGRTVFCAGGALSIDRRLRTPGRDWFREEVLLRGDLPERLPHADIVASHTVPLRFGDSRFGIGGGSFDPDPSRETLDAVLDACAPSLWLGAHFHRRVDWMHGQTECRVLDMLRGTAAGPDDPCTFRLSGTFAGVPAEPGWMLPEGLFIPLRGEGPEAYADLSDMPGRMRAWLNSVVSANPPKTKEAFPLCAPPEHMPAMLHALSRKGWETWKTAASPR